jgi:CBS domain-containing protein
MRASAAGSTIAATEREEPPMTTAYAQRSHDFASLASVRVGEAMHAGVVICGPDASLSTVARMMAAHRIHAVVVAPGTEASEWGIVSDLDLATAVSEGALGGPTAGQVASTPNVSVRPEESVARAAQLMREYDTRHLIVLVPGAERPVGIVSTLDIADVVAELAQPHTRGAGAQDR